MKHLFLIGYRGSGKSTVGRLVAKRLGVAFVDTDDLVESRAGLTIREIFDSEGESGFRGREAEAILSATQNLVPTVIALGGGAVLRDENRELIRDSGRCVWLESSPESLFARISGDATSADRRPKLSDRGGYDEVVAVLSARKPLYSELAQKRLMTDTLSPEQLSEEIADWVNSSDQHSKTK